MPGNPRKLRRRILSGTPLDSDSTEFTQSEHFEADNLAFDEEETTLTKSADTSAYYGATEEVGSGLRNHSIEGPAGDQRMTLTRLSLAPGALLGPGVLQRPVGMSRIAFQRIFMLQSGGEDPESLADKTVDYKTRCHLQHYRGTPTSNSVLSRLQASFERVRDTWSDNEMAARDLRKIESKFGSTVASYFTFLKWVLGLNIVIMVLILGTIVLPAALMSASSFSNYIDRSCSGPNVSWCQADDARLAEDIASANRCSKSYLDSTLNDPNYDLFETIGNDFLDFFSGTGWMANTEMFYGRYHNQTYISGSKRYDYPMGFVLITMTFGYLLISLFFVVQNSGQAFKQSILSTEDTYNRFISLTLCGWDYALSTEKAVPQKHGLMLQTFKSLTYEECRVEEEESRSMQSKLNLAWKRILVNCVCALVVGAAIVAVFTLSACNELIASEFKKIGGSLGELLGEFLPSMTLSLVNVSGPVIFQLLVRLEEYSPERQVQLTLLRTVTLRLSTAFFLILPLLGFEFGGTLTFCVSNVINNDTANGTASVVENTCKRGQGSISSVYCPETNVGQALYRIVVLEIIMTPLLVLFVDFPRRLLVNKFDENSSGKRYNWYVQFLIRNIGLKDFSLPVEVIGIIYSQTIYWSCFYFAPLASSLAVIKCLLLFYLKKWTVLKNCRQPTQIYQANLSGYFSFILIGGLLMATMITGYSIAATIAPISCGPWRLSAITHTAWDGLKLYVMESSEFTRILYTISSNVIFVVIFLLALILIVVVMLVRAAAHRRAVQLLKEQLVIQSQDKKFFLECINKERIILQRLARDLVRQDASREL